MKFIDEASIILIAGDGGNGVLDTSKTKGLAAGGSGGNGGNIYAKGSPRINTLLPIQKNKIHKAENGQNGKYQNSNGKNGHDIILEVPLNTKININNQEIIIKDTNYTLLAKGGKGGMGNFKYCKIFGFNNQNLYKCTKGEKGQRKNVKLSLSIMADIGLVGKPSAGKSTFISKISNSKPKIADYPFTTLKPNLGIVRTQNNQSFVVADLPGLIKGAALGKGLGVQFLKHIQKCKAIAYIIDFGHLSINPIDEYEELWNEINSFDKSITKLPSIIFANKIDLKNYRHKLKLFKSKYSNIEIIGISALSNKNINIAIKKMEEIVEKITF